MIERFEMNTLCTPLFALSRFGIRLLSGLAFATVIFCNVTDSDAGPNDSLPIRPGFMHVILATDASTYHLGQAIRVSIALENMTAQKIFVPLVGPPYSTVRLIVSDPQGNLIQPGAVSLNDLWAGRFDPAFVPVKPGATIQLTWPTPDHRQFTQFASLADWGYQLTTPGRYTIAAIPQVIGRTVTPDNERILSQFRADPTTIASNTVTITITP